ncbi:hypothetical protein DPX39_100127000 [Trypanosoma brucei equiperdum]|uniref:Uncharacterized protein n=1 Tax=Trypanosoma brucei equiperdum TaxID=630700 RepID=A0A3L6L240_9TRYP|nr:hypothetical protein DPX39_100127000 [Trypanosoma brucei equiperdum]
MDGGLKSLFFNCIPFLSFFFLLYYFLPRTNLCLCNVFYFSLSTHSSGMLMSSLFLDVLVVLPFLLLLLLFPFPQISPFLFCSLAYEFRTGKREFRDGRRHVTGKDSTNGMDHVTVRTPIWGNPKRAHRVRLHVPLLFSFFCFFCFSYILTQSPLLTRILPLPPSLSLSCSTCSLSTCKCFPSPPPHFPIVQVETKKEILFERH